MEGLKQIETKYPSLSTTTQDIADLYSKKLWHNITDKIEHIVHSKELDQKGEDLLNFYEQFVSKFDLKVNLRKLALVVLAISGKLTDPKRAIAFVEAVHSKIEKDKRKDKEKSEALIILKIELALWKLRLQDFSGCKHTLGEAKEAIEKEGFVDTSVQSTYYRVKSEYLKRSEELNEFYKHSLLYLAYTPIETIPLHQQQAIAFDIGIAALLGDKIYNFGELLAHPIVESLNGTQAEWLVKMLFAFNKGDIAQYKSLIQTYRQQLEQSPILSKHSKFLEEKIQLMCIMELVFQRATGNRTIPFTEIASATGRNLDSVEVLLLRALSYTLIKGVIDQIDQTIHVTWVQPRVLDKSQISNLKEKIGAWLGKVDDTINYLETEGMMAI